MQEVQCAAHALQDESCIRENDCRFEGNRECETIRYGSEPQRAALTLDIQSSKTVAFGACSPACKQVVSEESRVGFDDQRVDKRALRACADRLTACEYE